MNLFCFSLAGSMDDLYEPVPEKQVGQDNQERMSGRIGSLMTPFVDNGQAHSSLFMDDSDIENTKPKRKSIQRSMSENKVFEGKTVSGTIQQEPSYPEHDFGIRRLCQPKDLEEDNFLLSNIHNHQGRKLHDLSYQNIKSVGDSVESMRTLKRLQKRVWTKKAKVSNLSEIKPTSIDLRSEDEALISCMKLGRSQEKKVSHLNTRRKEEMESRFSISAPLVRSSTSTGCNLAEMLPYDEGEFQIWSSWKHFPENPLWMCVDFQIDQVEPWDHCFCCTHHPRLKPSYTDTDLPQSWVSL